MSVWSAIEKSIQSAGNRRFLLTHREAVVGGDISQAYMITDGQQRFFVKVNTFAFLENFQQEAIGLIYLKRCPELITPSVIAVGSFRQQSFLVLDYLELNQTGEDSHFAESLASLHQLIEEQFGFEANNYIGANLQINNWSTDWGQYFVEYRLRPQFEWLFHKGLNTAQNKELIVKSKELMDKSRSYLNQHSPKPSLVHGDLWQGNYRFDSAGNPVIYDPACYFADSEVDIAMLEMFGSPSKEFYSVYYQFHPRKSGAEARKKIYNLYHLLNHANLFGGGYLISTKSSVDEILRLI